MVKPLNDSGKFRNNSVNVPSISSDRESGCLDMSINIVINITQKLVRTTADYFSRQPSTSAYTTPKWATMRNRSECVAQNDLKSNGRHRGGDTSWIEQFGPVHFRTHAPGTPYAQSTDNRLLEQIREHQQRSLGAQQQNSEFDPATQYDDEDVLDGINQENDLQWLAMMQQKAPQGSALSQRIAHRMSVLRSR